MPPTPVSCMRYTTCPAVGMGKGHEHDANAVATADRRYLAIALGLICCLMVGEVVAAALSGSLALFADAGHLLTDVGALAASLWAARLAARPAKGIWTFGLKRAEILSAAVNGLSLAAIAVVIAVEAIMRLLHPTPVDGLVVLVVALTGVVVDLAATLVLARASRTSLNVRGAFVHMVTDLYAFAGTAVAGLVIMLTGFRRADALASLVVVALMAKAAWCLLRDSGRDPSPRCSGPRRPQCREEPPDGSGARGGRPRPARLDCHLGPPQPFRPRRGGRQLLRNRARPPNPRPAPGLCGCPFRSGARHLPARAGGALRSRTRHPRLNR